MRIMKRIAMFLSNENMSINHVASAGAVYAALSEGYYIAAAVIFVIAVAYCSAMSRLS